MNEDERYDVVIIGAGHNGTTTAAYLAKCGLSVCVLEDRPECGGAQENAEPVAGVRICPHAVGNYAGAAPGWEQLELWKYGFRMDRNPREDSRAQMLLLMQAGAGGVMTTDGLVPSTQKDAMGWAKISGLLTDPSHVRELLRATFWCPPHPPEVELTPENIPFMQVYKQYQPDVWTRELLEMSMFDLMDEYMETEPPKVGHAYIALMSGAHGHMEGVAIPALMSVAACTTMYGAYDGSPMVPRGNIHGYYHALMRCALAHGVVFRTCCPAEEIIIEHGRAVGVRLRDDAAWGEKKIWADKAVISATDIKQTFLRLIGPQHLDTGFMQRIKDLVYKGGSLYVNHFLTREPLRTRSKFQTGARTISPEYEKRMGGNLTYMGGSFPHDSRELYFDHIADVLGRQGNPTVPPERVPWLFIGTSSYDASHSQCTRPDRYINGDMVMMVPTPEYHPEGPDALNKIREQMNAYMIAALSQVAENLDSDNLVQHIVNTPYDQELRNTGMLGGSWYGLRHCRDQWWNERPLPELSRYRAPIEGLYLSHQSSAHPGGLCLMACGYNLMHILIEDGIAQPGDWWYPSPWYIPEKGKISAIPR